MLLLALAALIASGGATAALSGALVGVPIGIRDAAAPLRSKRLAAREEDRQRAGERECHNTHFDFSFGDFSVSGILFAIDPGEEFLI
jgi:hypothetical protein